MTVPRADSTIAARVKKLEDELRRIKIAASITQSAVEPSAVAKNSMWIDSSAGNEPKVFDGTAWVPVRDETIAVAQTTAVTAQTTADAAQTDADAATAAAATAQAAADALQTELDAAETDVAANAANIATLTGTTIPALQTSVDANAANITTLTGTTIPGLSADIAAAQADVDAILPIGTTDISDDAITTPKIAAGQITAVKIAADTITAAQIAAAAITASELAANAVTAGKIAAGTIVAADISSGAITTVKLAAGAVTANEIAAGTITATQLAAGAITATKIAAGAIDGKTITGALIRTAASGQRVEIDSVDWQEVKFYSGAATESSPGRVRSDNLSGDGYLVVESPELAAAPGQFGTLTLHSAAGGFGEAILDADRTLVNGNDFVRLSTIGHQLELSSDGKFTHDNVNTVVTTGLTGTAPQPVTVTESTLVATQTSTTYAAASPVCGTPFVAPPSGKVYVTVSAHFLNNNNTFTSFVSYAVRTGATIGSGTVVLAADDNRSIACGRAVNTSAQGETSGSRRKLLTGLNPGSNYNVRTEYRVTGGSTNLISRELLIEPVL